MNAIYSSLSPFFLSIAPFNRMEPEHLQWMMKRMRISYFAEGEVIVSPEQKVVDQFYIVKQGLVYGEQFVEKSAEVDTWVELEKGECFPLGALLARRPAFSVYRAGKDTFCFELAADDFHEMLGISEPFRNFCTRQIADLLEHSKQVIQTQYTHSGTERQSLSSPLSSTTTARNALEKMQEMRLGSMIAVDDDGRPLGILTLADILVRITIPQANLDQAVIN